MKMLDYWLWLSLKKGIAPEKMVAILERFSSPEEIYNMNEKALKKAGLTKKLARHLADKDLSEVELIKERCKEVGIRILTLDSPYYPEKLRQIPDPPCVLYVRSRERMNLNDKICIAMVGNREMSSYGEAVALNISAELANAGIVVVSGMARGIDGASHRGALNAGGTTVAVLGCGADIVYPPEHDRMMSAIIEHGMVITEYPPGAPPLPKHFPLRNRIISGLSDGVVVVEAPKRSGSLITADYALKQNRDVFAVPGDVTKKRSLGCNRLIHQGAILVNSAADVLREYEVLYINTLKQCINNSEDEYTEKQEASEPAELQASEVEKEHAKVLSYENPRYRDLPDAQRKIIGELSFDPVSLEQLLARTGLTVDVLSAELVMLEISGFIKTLPGKHFILND